MRRPRNGGAVAWETMLDGKSRLSTAGNGALDSTNVTICFLQQARYFSGWWAASESTHHVGLAARFMFGFGSAKSPGPAKHNAFASDVAFPILKEILQFVLLTVGPRKAVGAPSPVRPWTFAAEHEDFIRSCRLVSHAKVRQCRPNGILIGGLKKFVFWASQGALMASLVSQACAYACARTPLTSVVVAPEISQDAIHCGVHLFLLRSLFGLACLDGDIENRTWSCKRKSESLLSNKAILQRVLRASLSDIITVQDLESLGIPFADEFGHPAVDVHSRVTLLWLRMGSGTSSCFPVSPPSAKRPERRCRQSRRPSSARSGYLPRILAERPRIKDLIAPRRCVRAGSSL